MRHLHQFPDEAHVQDLIEEEVRGDDLQGLSLSRQISFEQFEKFMLKHLMAEDPDQIDRFKPDSFSDMMDAFKVLDPEGKGYIREDVLTYLLNNQGTPFRKREFEQFKNFVTFKPFDDKSVLFYEDYVRKLIDENDRHLDSLTQGYDEFKKNYGKAKAEAE